MDEHQLSNEDRGSHSGMPFEKSDLKKYRKFKGKQCDGVDF